MSGLLTGVVVVLVVCHTPKTFLNIQVKHKTEAFSSPMGWGIQIKMQTMEYISK